MKIPSPIIVDAADLDATERIAALPTGPGVFCLEAAGRVTHLTSAPNLQRRVTRTITKLGRYFNEDRRNETSSSVLRILSWQSQSKLETSLLLYELARQHFPEEYLRRVHLRLPWFVGLLTRDPFPRLVSANRIPQGCEPVVGPFARRDLALLYEQELQSAFLLRRCTEILVPHPQHPGCIYGEMRQCLRPCQCAVESSRYLAEAAEVSAVLRDNGSKTLRDMAKVRDEAVGSLDFEAAARIHKQLERLQSAKSARDSVVTNIDNFNGLAVTFGETRLQDGPAHPASTVVVFPMVQGYWLDPIRLPLDQAWQAKGLDTLLQSQLRVASDEQHSADRSRPEDLALFARWYYSSWREGVWIPFLHVNDLPVRKVIRAIQKVRKSSECRVGEPSLQDN